VQARERHLGRARQIEVVALDAVDVDLVRGQEARAVHRLLTHEHRREDRQEPFRGDAVECEAVHGQLEQGSCTNPVGEA
jgi:hypothetical protein